LTPEELQSFLRSVHASNIRRQFKIALQLILITLARKSELMLAQWKDVHVDDAEWHIPVENSKTGKPHIVYLSTQALMLFKQLKALAGNSQWVLPGRGTLAKPFAHNALNKALKVSLLGQEIPAFTIHDLRRTASTLLHEKGWPSDVVEKALNHTVGVCEACTTGPSTPTGVRRCCNSGATTSTTSRQRPTWLSRLLSMLDGAIQIAHRYHGRSQNRGTLADGEINASKPRWRSDRSPADGNGNSRGSEEHQRAGQNFAQGRGCCGSSWPSTWTGVSW